MIVNNSNIQFAPPLLWGLMGFAFFFERYGSMHIQLYSLTNNIIWHKANGVAGFIYILTSYILFPLINIYSFPMGMFIGYIFFYCWYTAYHSYKTFNLKFINFEYKTSFAPLITLCIFEYYLIIKTY